MRRGASHTAVTGVLMLGALLVACAGAGDAAARDRAIEVARQVAERDGYDLEVYELRRAERVTEGSFAGRWHVFFEHRPPTPPGGHFGVYVDPATWQGELFPGE